MTRLGRWGGSLACLLGGASGACIGPGYGHHIGWLLGIGVALAGVAGGVFGFWIRVMLP